MGHADLPVAANSLVHLGEGRWSLSAPFANANCHSASGTCKCAVAASACGDAALKLLIGDGRSDECLAREADFVQHCEENGLPHLAFRDFAEARGHLAMLLDAPVEAAGRVIAGSTGAMSRVA